MRVVTEHAILPVPASQAYDYLSRIERLPEWATEFAADCELEGEVAVVQTAGGPLECRYDCHCESGVIDFLIGPAAVPPTRVPSRVVPLTPDSSIFLFTLPQGPDRSDEAFESDRASVRRELDALPERLTGSGG